MEVIVSILIILIGYGFLTGIILKLLGDNENLFDEQMQLLLNSNNKELEIIELKGECAKKELKITDLDRQVVQLKHELEKKQKFYIDGKIIKAKREELGLTQDILADKLGISKRYLREYEQCRRTCANYELTRKFKDVLGYFHTPTVRE